MNAPLDIGLRRELLAASRGLIDPRRWWVGVVHPIRTVRAAVGPGPLLPLLVLVGLNATDELDRAAFGVLLPEIRDHFGLSNAAMLTTVALTALAALLLQVPIAVLADRLPRVPAALMGAVAWSLFSLATGIAGSVAWLIVARSGAGIGRAVVDPTHGPLLSDYYDVEHRMAVIGLHRSANAVGQFLGPLLAGWLAVAGSWRTPFLVFAVPTLVLVVIGLWMREPVRGVHERRAAGAAEEEARREEPALSFGHAWRTVWRIEVLRRLWYAVPFLSVGIVGFVSLGGILYEEVYGLNAAARGTLAAFVEPAGLVGLAVGTRVGTVLLARDPSLVFRFLRWVSVVCGAAVAMFALAPNLVVAVAANVVLSATLATLLPGLFTVLSLAVPPRVRSLGFALTAWWALPGLFLLPAVGWVADRLGARWGILVMVPILLLGGVIVAGGGSVVGRDLRDAWAGSLARSRHLDRRRSGGAPILAVEDLEVAYGSRRVIRGVSFEVADGEVLALIGTNGAGKSTLLRALCGLTEADRGTVLIDGADLTHAPPHEIAAAGVSLVSGGRGVAHGLTVAENLRLAGWRIDQGRAGRARAAARIEEVLTAFPALVERRGQRAERLSGGQQQQLALAMALVARPRLLLIDELSLGLAPSVVARLVDMVAEVAAAGTTVIVVEQSLNVAMQLADRAVFLERGVVAAAGPMSGFRTGDDLVRSVFLGAARRPESGPSDASLPTGGVEQTDAPALRLEAVTRRFGGVVAVDAVDLEVPAGQVLGLIGANGAGKTTLLQMISGFLPCDGGRILLHGNDITNDEVSIRARAGLGRCFQNGLLVPGLSVADYLALACERHRVVRDPFSAALRTPAEVGDRWAVAARVDTLLERFGLAGYRAHPCASLSTGTRRIVDLAAAVAQSPSVLLLDEPAAGLAQAEVEALAGLLVDVRAELDATLVIVEHDMAMLGAATDRLVALEAGSVLADGPPAEVLTDPLVIAAYLGSDESTIARSAPIAPEVP